VNFEDDCIQNRPPGSLTIGGSSAVNPVGKILRADIQEGINSKHRKRRRKYQLTESPSLRRVAAYTVPNPPVPMTDPSWYSLPRLLDLLDSATQHDHSSMSRQFSPCSDNTSL